MKRKFISWFLLANILFLVISAIAEEEKKLSSLEKSIIFPGWGQICEKRYFEGIIFVTSEIFCLAGIFKNGREGNKYYKLYKSADNTYDAIKYRDLTIKFDKRRNRFIAGAISVWVLNLLDMSLIIKKEKNMILKFGGDSIEVTFKKEF